MVSIVVKGWISTNEYLFPFNKLKLVTMILHDREKRIAKNRLQKLSLKLYFFKSNKYMKLLETIRIYLYFHWI